MLGAGYSTVKKRKRSQLTASMTRIMQVSAGVLSVTGEGCPG